MQDEDKCKEQLIAELKALRRCVAESVTDITGSERVEEALQQSERETTILNQIANVFLTIPDEKIYEEVLAVIVNALKCRYGVFGYIGDSGDLIIPGMTKEIWSDCQVEEKSTVFPRHLWGDSLSDKAIKEKKSFSSDGPFQTPEGHLPVYNFLTVPIVFAGKTIGVASVANKDGGFSLEDKSVLERIAGNISPILNTRLQRDKQELERKRMEDALRESEARLRQIIDLVPHMIFVKDWDGKYLLVNKAVAEAYETNVSALTGKYHADFHPDESELQTMLQDDREVITKGETRFIPEEPCTDARGNLRFLQTTKVPFHILRDKTPAVLGVAIDITDNKQAEEVLRESEEKFRALVESAPDAIFIQKEGRLAYVNDAAIRLYGAASEKELLGQDSLERVHPDYRARVLERIRSVNEEKKPAPLMELKHLKLDGTTIDVEAHSEPIRYQKNEGALVFVRDVTERKRMEEALREAWLYTRSLIEASLDPLVTISPGGKITDVNKATELVTGFSRNRLIGSDFSDYFTEPEKAGEVYRKVISQGFVKDYPLTIRHTSGRLTDVLYNAAVYMNESGTMQGVFATARDITERKRAEEARRESEACLAATIESIPFEFWVMGPDGCYSMQNRICRKHYGDIIGKKPEHVCPNETILSVWRDNNRRAFAGELVKGEVKYAFENDERYYNNVVAPIHDADRTLGIIGINVDITDCKRLEAALKKVNEELESQVEERTKELDAQTRRLEEFNAALRVLLKQREGDKTELEESILMNVKSLILPYVEKLKKSRLCGDQMTYLTIIESHMREITSPFTRRLSEKYLGFTPVEVQTVGLIREGKTTQEIADLLCVSENTVSSNRFHIRKKLGLTNQKVNLRYYLQSFDK